MWIVQGLVVAAGNPVNALAKACRTVDLSMSYRQLTITSCYSTAQAKQVLQVHYSGCLRAMKFLNLCSKNKLLFLLYSSSFSIVQSASKDVRKLSYCGLALAAAC